MTEQTTTVEKVYYLYRTFSGKVFCSDKKVPCAELVSEHKEKQMAAESPEVKQSS